MLRMGGLCDGLKRLRGEPISSSRRKLRALAPFLWRADRVAVRFEIVKVAIGLEPAIDDSEEKRVLRETHETVNLDRRDHDSDLAPLEHAVLDHREVRMLQAPAVVDALIDSM